MREVALIIIFNHRYDKNLSYLEDMYRNRFSNRFYLMPFYDGSQENVIPVYDRSIFFEGYIAQGANVFYEKKFKHYLFVADDMIIHPGINENTYQDFFEVNEHQSWIPELMSLQDIYKPWNGTLEAVFYQKKQPWIEVGNELPTYEVALEKFKKQGIVIRELKRKEIFGSIFAKNSSLSRKIFLLFRIVSRIRHPFKNSYKLPYPICGSYSDICLVSGDCIKRFAHYCGVFSSTLLDVEVALPTALVLASDTKIKSEKSTKRKGMAYWNPWGAFYKSEEQLMSNLEKKYKNLDDMITNFPDNQLYIHPVKLSKWLNK